MEKPQESQGFFHVFFTIASWNPDLETPPNKNQSDSLEFGGVEESRVMFRWFFGPYHFSYLEIINAKVPLGGGYVIGFSGG